MQNVLQTFLGSIQEQLTAIFDSSERIYGLFLCSALLLGLGYYLQEVFARRTKWSIKDLVAFLFPRQIWLHPSTRLDIQTFFLNNLIKSFLIGPLFISGVSGMYAVVRLWEQQLGVLDTVKWDTTLIMFLYSISLILFSDLTRFLLHYALHKIPFLWQLHQYHHSAEVMTPLTLYRVHPLEYFLFKMRSIFSFAFVTGSFYFFFRQYLGLWTILGSNGAVFLFNLIGSNLRHSHIPIRYGKWLEHLFISPAQHQIHHGKDTKYYDKNFGSMFAIWDWIAGSLQVSKRQQKIDFGLQEYAQKKPSLIKLTLAPVYYIVKSVKKLFP